jgi:hypothetical protein
MEKIPFKSVLTIKILLLTQSSFRVSIKWIFTHFFLTRININIANNIYIVNELMN